MAKVDAQAVWELVDAIGGVQGPDGRSSMPATVTRIDEEGTVWVRIAGGAEETPLSSMYAGAGVGDVVSVSLGNLQATGTGNLTSPAATARELAEAATVARESLKKASAAAEAAESADRSAGEAVILVTYEYASNYDEAAPPDAGWSEEYPDWASDAVHWRRANIVHANGSQEQTAPERVSGNKGADAVQVKVTSTNGTVFKSNLGISTVLEATVIAGGERITDLAALKSRFGNSAYLEWAWRGRGEGSFSTLVATDPRIRRGGFQLEVTPDDIDVQAVITCGLVY